jgi:hypothetical protein
MNGAKNDTVSLEIRYRACLLTKSPTPLLVSLLCFGFLPHHQRGSCIEHAIT